MAADRIIAGCRLRTSRIQNAISHAAAKQEAHGAGLRAEAVQGQRGQQDSQR